MNEFILKESISPAGLECPAEFEHYIITDGKTTILAKDDSEGHEQALMLLAVMNAYGGTIWADDSHKPIIGYQKEQIDAITAQLAAKDAEIERLKQLCVRLWDSEVGNNPHVKKHCEPEFIAKQRAIFIKENNL